MFYQLIKTITRCALLFFCKKKIVLGDDLHHLKGPAIIAANHPNSMMDAILIGCSCKQPVHFIIRSDMFNNPLFRFLLKHLHGIPIYRQSEEKEKLRENFASFAVCRDVLKNNGIIIIFSEGITLHDWKLKPLKSGTAKLISYVLQDVTLQNTLKVLPVGLTYSDYQYIGRTVIIQSKKIFYPGREITGVKDGLWKQQFNQLLTEQLRLLVPDMTAAKEVNRRNWQLYLSNVSTAAIRTTDGHILHEMGKYLSEENLVLPFFQHLKRYHFANHRNIVAIITGFLLSAIPAMAGWLLNAIYYYPLTTWCRHKTAGTIFFDALAIGIYVLTYPLYVLIMSMVLGYATSIPFWVFIASIPLLGCCTIYTSIQYYKLLNYYRSSQSEKQFFENLMRDKTSYS